MNAGDQKQLKLTVIIGTVVVVVFALVVFVSTHWQEVLGVQLVFVAWVLSLPAWVWLCLSILTGCRWIAKAIRAKGKIKDQS